MEHSIAQPLGTAAVDRPAARDPGRSGPLPTGAALGPTSSSSAANLRVRLAGLSIVLLSLGVRLPRLADHSVWWDEGFAIYLARMPLLQAAYRTAFDVHPPLHYWFLHYWIRLVGESEFAVRYSTVLFAVLTVALVASLGSKLLGPAAGLLAALFLALARLDVAWSQEMRMYTLATALVAGQLYFVVALGRRPTRRRWIGLVTVAVVSLYTLYISGITFFALALAGFGYGLVERRDWPTRGRWVRDWLLAAAATVALYLPWLIVLARTARPAPVVEWTLDLKTYLWAYATVMPLGISTYLDRYLGITAALTLLLLPGLLTAWRRPERRTLALASLSALTLMPMIVYLMSLPNPIFFKPNLYVRYLLILLPIYDLLLAWSATVLWRWWRPAGALAALLVVGSAVWALWGYYPTKVKVDDYASLVRFLSAHAQPGDEIVLYPDRDWPIFGYYNHTGLPLYGVGTDPGLTAAEATSLGQRLLAAHPSLWLVSIDNGHDSDPAGILANWLHQHARTAGSFSVANRTVALLTRDPGRTLTGWTLPPEVALGRPAAPGLTVVGADLALTEVPAGSPFNLAVYWQAHAPTPAGARAVVWLTGTSGPPVLMRSWPLALTAGERWRADYTLPIPAGLAAGRYRLFVGVRTSHQDRLAEPVALPDLWIDSPAPPPTATPAPVPTARFGSAIGLAGWQVTVNGREQTGTVALRPGDRITVTLDWQDLQATDRRYTGFAHLIGPPNPASGTPVWSQQDHYPTPAGAAASPTDSWLPGQTLVDQYTLTVPASAPAGAYAIEIGLYELPGGERAPVVTSAGASDHLVIARGTVGR